MRGRNYQMFGTVAGTEWLVMAAIGLFAVALKGETMAGTVGQHGAAGPADVMNFSTLAAQEGMQSATQPRPVLARPRPAVYMEQSTSVPGEYLVAELSPD